MSELETISELMRDIAAFRSVIAYFEGRILRKQIAIEEIAHSADARKELNSELVILPKQTMSDAFRENGSHHGLAFDRRRGMRITMPQIIVEFLATHPPEPFGPQAVIAWSLENYPEKTSVRKSVYVAISHACTNGILRRIPGGLGWWVNQAVSA